MILFFITFALKLRYFDKNNNFLTKEMKQAYFKLLVAFIGVFCGAKAFAYDCEVDGIYYYRISATELEVANRVFSDQNRSAYTGAVTIPSTVT